MALAAAVLAALVVVGGLLVASAWTPGRAPGPARPSSREPVIAVAGGVIAGVVALAVTGWLAAGTGARHRWVRGNACRSAPYAGSGLRTGADRGARRVV